MTQNVVTVRGRTMTEVEAAAKELAQIRARQQAVWQRVATAVRSAADQGIPETELARQAGVDRMTIRRMLGKR